MEARNEEIRREKRTWAVTEKNRKIKKKNYRKTNKKIMKARKGQTNEEEGEQKGWIRRQLEKKKIKKNNKMTKGKEKNAGK